MVQVIPKQFHKKNSVLGPILATASILLIFIIIAGYLVIRKQTENIKVSIEENTSRLDEMQTPRGLDLQKKIFEYKRKIKDVNLLLSQRKKAGDFINFLSNFVHPNIHFIELDLDMKKGSAVLTGMSPDFASIGQQVDIFQKQDFIEQTELTDVSLTEENGIKFVLKLSLFSKKEDKEQ